MLYSYIEESVILNSVVRIPRKIYQIETVFYILDQFIDSKEGFVNLGIDPKKIMLDTGTPFEFTLSCIDNRTIPTRSLLGIKFTS
jgi:hypothetical protein